MKKFSCFLLLSTLIVFSSVYGQGHNDKHDSSIVQAERWLQTVDYSKIIEEAIVSIGLKGSEAESYRLYLNRFLVAEDRHLFFQKVKSEGIFDSDDLLYRTALLQKYIKRYSQYKLDEGLSKSRQAELKQKGISITPLGVGEVCRNLDFEEGTTAGWNGFSGSACTSPTPCYLYSDLSQHYILNSGYDALVGGTTLPNVAPGGGTYSLKLGNSASGSGAARLTQTFLVTPVNSAFTLKYAVLLEDPVSGHSDAERPYFNVSMNDGSGNPIACANYRVMAKPPIQDFIRVGFTNYYYRPWTVVSIPLSAYIGQNVTIQIDVSDCSQGAHLGYAYIDGSCLPIQVSSQFNVSCNGDPLTLKGPDGFVSYSWSGPGVVGVATGQSVVVNQPGIYSVEVTSFTGSTCKGIVTYEVLAAPNTNAGNDATICIGSSTQLNATGVSSQVTWSPSTGLSSTTITNPVASPIVTTTYTVTSCGVSDDVTVFVNSGYQLAITKDTSLCGLAPVNLLVTPSVAGTYTYSWSPSIGLSATNIANPIANPLTSQTYTVTVVDANGCVRTKTVSITIINGIPTDILISPQAKYCGDPITLTAVGGSNFVWTDLLGNAPVGLSCTNCSNPVATPLTTSTYVVTAQNSFPCKNKDTITIQSLPVFNLAITAADTTCGTAVANIMVTPSIAGSYTYGWSPSVSSSNVFFGSVSATTDYSVIVTNSLGCSRAVGTRRTVMNPIAPLVLSTSRNDVCVGQTAQLSSQVNAAAINSYTDQFDNPNLNMSLWSTVDGATQSNLCASVTGAALLFNGVGTRAVTTRPFNSTLGGSISFYIKFPTGTSLPCEKAGTGQNVVLEYSNNAGLSWGIMNTYYEYNYANFTFISLVIPNTAMTSNTMFRWRQLSSIGSGDVWLLDNVNVSINYNRALTYSWTPAAGINNTTIANPIATLNNNETYTLSVSDGKCSATASIPLRMVSLAVRMDTSCTNGQPVQLNATVTGNVNVGGLCSINSSPVLTGSIQTYNQGVNYFTNGGIGPFRGYYHDYRGQYLYTAAELNAIGITSGQISTIGFTVSSKGSYIPYSNFTIKLGCMNAGSLSTAVGWLPTTLVYSASSYNSINGLNAFNLTSPYVWDGVSSLVVEICYDNSSYTSDDYIYYTNTTANQCMYTYTDGGSGCTMNPAYITVSRPNLYLRHATVSVQPAYTWLPATNLTDATISNPLATNINNQTYTVSVNIGSCILTQSVVVSTDQSPSLTPQTQTAEICLGQSATLAVSSDNGTLYTWSPASDLNTPSSNTVISTPTVSKSYTVQVENSFKCKATAVANVVIVQDFSLAASASQTSGCVGEQATLTASGGPNYSWSPTAGIANPNDASIVVSPMMPTSYTVTSSNLCFQHDKIVDVNLSPIPVVNVDAKNAICSGEALTLNATYNPGYTYIWSPSGSAINNPIVAPLTTTNYSVQVTNGYCTKSFTHSVTVTDPVHVDFEVNHVEGQAPFIPRFFNNSTGVSSYLWTLGNGQTSTNFTPDVLYNEGEYKVLLYAQNSIGCSAKDSVVLTVLAVDFFIPNLITPNGDGFNDVFEITTQHGNKRWDCQIVNRWGAVIFKQDNYTHEWEAQGESDGIYYYYITDKVNGKKYNGWVQVLGKK